MENLNFRTQYKAKTEKNQIDYSSELVLFGSCFSENIGRKFDYFKFKSLTNPYGILFNPIAIENAILDCIEKKTYQEKDLIFHNELWHSFKHHSDFSDMDSNVVLDKINTSIRDTHKRLKTASHIIITFGTAWVYDFLEHGKTVANCHKIPQKKFNKKLLSIEEIEQSISTIKKALKKTNPKAIIIITVSPVRHLKDGMIENTLSKSHLLSATHKSLDNSTKYFPSYEVMMDDLRDYRFYSEDMVHPNNLAIKHIWSIFKDSWISQKAQSISKEIEHIQKSIEHKPFNPKSIAHKKFKENLSQKIQLLNTHTKRTFFQNL